MAVYRPDYNLIDLWYSPHQSQWAALGYTSGAEVEEDFGGAFFEYDYAGEQRAEDLATMKKSHIDENIANTATKGQLELAMREKVSQFESGFQQKQKNRERDFMNDQLKISKRMETSKALLGLNSEENINAKTGVRSGAIGSARENAVSNVTAKIDSAMASTSFKRERVKNDIKSIKNKTGSFASDGRWMPGTEDAIKISAHDRNMEMKTITGEQSRDLMDFKLAATKEQLYDDWVVGSIDMFESLIRTQPKGPAQQACNDRVIVGDNGDLIPSFWVNGECVSVDE